MTSLSIPAGSKNSSLISRHGGIDHLVYSATDLEAGMDAIAATLGVRPVKGGRHPDYGTHNALLSLGPATYLEVIAPDPDLPLPKNGTLASLGSNTNPRLVTWVLRVDAINAVAENNAAIGIGKVQSGCRATPGGDLLNWQLSDPYAMPLQGAVPFLINWGDTPHPATVAPPAGELCELRIEHPCPDEVAAALLQLGVQLAVTKATRFRLVATIMTSNGEVTLD